MSQEVDIYINGFGDERTEKLTTMRSLVNTITPDAAIVTGKQIGRAHV